MPRIVTNPHGTFTIWHDAVGRAIESGAFWDTHIRYAADEADHGGWAIDVGANIGFHTAYFARLFQHVLALEPHPSTYQLFCQNMVANGIEARVTSRQLAAYDRVTTLRIAGPTMLGWSVPSETDLDQCGAAASIAFVLGGIGVPGNLCVPAVEVDSLMDLLPIPRVTFVKVDAQGCDLRALHGMSRLIARDHPSIVFEYEHEASSWHGDTLEDYFHFFLDRGYAVTKIQDDLEDYHARYR